MNALAQSPKIIKDTSSTDTSSKLIIIDAPAKPQSKPLIILDGAIYKGKLKSINPNDIMNVDILKGKSATDVYGTLAKDGAIVIKTKKWRKVDTISKAIQLDSAVSKDALYVVDGEPSTNKLNNVNPKIS